MIGIYKITNKLNNKVYIGQSININRRFSEHLYKKNQKIEIDLLGRKNFSFDVLELCEKEHLNDKEKFWIRYYNSNIDGYNCNIGGGYSFGENNGRAILNEKDVILIRESYNNHENKFFIYDTFFSNRISKSYFSSLWEGRSWGHIMPEVFTKKIKSIILAALQ